MKWSKAEQARAEQMADVARRFCKLIESRHSLRKVEFIKRCAELVAEVQLRLIGLLQVRSREVPEPGLLGKNTLPDWLSMFKSLGRKLGKDDGYYLVYDPSKRTDPVFTSLSDDLADVYLDLARGLPLLECEDPASSHGAVCMWKWAFLSHTGHHCASAMRALQELLERYHEDS